MRKFTLTLLATTAAVGLAVGQATAADLPRKAPPPMVAPPPPLWNWTGLYLGGSLGVGISRNQFTQGACSADHSHFDSICTDIFNASEFGFNPNLGSHNGVGIVGGVQLGYNWQFANSPVVIGIEGQYLGADIKGDHQNNFTLQTDGVTTGQERFNTKTNGIALITARLGLASGPQDRTLWYVKGGGAWAKTQVAGVGSWAQSTEVRTAAFGGDQKKWGWTVGTGVEWGLFDNWSARIEYDYLDFGNHGISYNGVECTDPGSCGGINRTVNLKQQIHLVTVGLNYRFNWWR
jgi:outer membrane immunogenic protein